jgi:DNA relaxase NicK
MNLDKYVEQALRFNIVAKEINALEGRFVGEAKREMGKLAIQMAEGYELAANQMRELIKIAREADESN